MSVAAEDGFLGIKAAREWALMDRRRRAAERARLKRPIRERADAHWDRLASDVSQVYEDLAKRSSAGIKPAGASGVPGVVDFPIPSERCDDVRAKIPEPAVALDERHADEELECAHSRMQFVQRLARLLIHRLLHRGCGDDDGAGRPDGGQRRRAVPDFNPDRGDFRC